MNKKEKEMFDLILLGIDQEETEHPLGWWETSTGALFGKNKKDDIKQYISKHYIHRETVLDGIRESSRKAKKREMWDTAPLFYFQGWKNSLSDIKTFINNN